MMNGHKIDVVSLLYWRRMVTRRTVTLGFPRFSMSRCGVSETKESSVKNKIVELDSPQRVSQVGSGKLGSSHCNRINAHLAGNAGSTVITQLLSTTRL